MHNSVNWGSEVKKKGTLLIVCGYQGTANGIRDRRASLTFITKVKTFLLTAYY